MELYHPLLSNAHQVGQGASRKVVTRPLDKPKFVSN